MIKRKIESDFNESISQFPVTGLIGPRQVGKTTLAKSAIYESEPIYLDLEKISDLNRLNDPEFFFEENQDKTIILDEIHHLPNLFPLIRAMVDIHRKPGRFVILGSASPVLLRQSAESLAGRISYIEMMPLSILEIDRTELWEDLWIYGGFPEVFLYSKSNLKSNWYRNFVSSYIHRDLPQYGLPANPKVTRQFLMMIASSNGGILNYSTFAKSLGLSIPTIKTYLGFFVEAFLIREVYPWAVNPKKRLVKAPKLYYRDTGMLHYLLGIFNKASVFGNLILGSSWESFVIAQVSILLFSDDEMYYYRTHDGAEIDLLIRRNNQWLAAAELKFSSAPVLTKGTYIAMEDLEIPLLHVIVPKDENYPLAKNVRVIGLTEFLKHLEQTKTKG